MSLFIPVPLSSVVATAQTVIKVVQYSIWAWQMYHTYMPIVQKAHHITSLAADYVMVQHDVPKRRNSI